MTIIEDELSELKKCCENVIPDSKLVACVPAMIRVEIRYVKATNDEAFGFSRMTIDNPELFSTPLGPRLIAPAQELR